jgi:hypothetical protein
VRGVGLLTALDASLRTLERIGGWQIVGNNGHIMTDGRGFVFYVSTSESPRGWTGIKKRLGFCRLTQDGDDEGCLYLERLPKADEAVLIREAIGIVGAYAGGTCRPAIPLERGSTLSDP